MEGNNNKNYCDVCGSGNGRCGSCGNMCGFGRNNLLRWFLGILIIVWVFSIGVKFGEIKAVLHGGLYGYKNMRFSPMPMMGGSWSSADEVYFTQSVPAQTSGTVKVIKSN